MSHGGDIEALIALFAKLPGFGPRSARRAVLALLKKREALMRPLARMLALVADQARPCSICGNLDSADPCGLCRDPARDGGILCVVEDIADLWALQRAHAFAGRFHVLGGTLSAMDGVGPDDLNIAALERRIAAGGVREVILAMSATVDGQTTAHYLADRLGHPGIVLSGLAHGVPVGGELDYLDDGTLAQALKARHRLRS